MQRTALQFKGGESPQLMRGPLDSRCDEEPSGNSGMSGPKLHSVRPRGGLGRSMQPYTKVQDTALLVLRLVVAAVFLYAGSAKWPFWSGPPEGMSVVLLNVVKFLSIVEPLGSLALVLGVLTRWAAAGLGIIMVGAIPFARVTLHAGLFTTPQGTGLDYNLLILAGCIVLIAFGAGGWSVDAIRKKALTEAAAAA
jgi:putative oxidoreductase